MKNLISPRAKRAGLSLLIAFAAYTVYCAHVGPLPVPAAEVVKAPRVVKAAGKAVEHPHTFGWKRPPEAPHPSTRYRLKVARASDLPKSVDLRPKDVPVYNQGQLGSCTGNGWAGAVQFRDHNRKLEAAKLTTLDTILVFYRIKPPPAPPKATDFIPSRLFIYWNERNLEGTTGSDAGAAVADGGKVVSTLGYPPEEAWPYRDTGSAFAKKPPKTAFTAAKAHVVPTPSSVDNTDLDEVRTALANEHPIVFGFNVYSSFDSIGSDAIYRAAGSFRGGHCVVAVGYDDKKKLIICRNSWGEEWGDAGYFYMPYSFFADTNQTTDAWAIAD